MGRAARSDLVVVLVLVFIAAFFRFYRLDELPIGLWRDEAANGLEALRVLNGDFAIFYGTREPMFIYLVAVSIAFLGRNPLAIRMVAAVVGTATIPVTYFLVKEVLRATNRRVRPVALLTGLWLATSYWHVNFSRLGFRGVLLPLFASAAFCFLWRGWNQLDDLSRRRSSYGWFALSGACLGLAFYTYTPSRFLPLLMIPFCSRALWVHVRARTGGRSSDAAQRPTIAPFAVLALSSVLIFAPLGRHFLVEPRSLLVRSGVTIFGTTTGEPLPKFLVSNSLRQLGMFGFLSDPNTRHNPAGRPAFDLITLAFFLIGCLQSLRRWRSMPYLFCFVWFLTMQIPAILTYPELPHSLRAIGSLPIAYLFPALGLEASWQWLRARAAGPRWRSAFALILSLSLIASAWLSFRDYFAPRVEEIELAKAFDPRFVEIAHTMDELDEPNAVWLIPVGPHDEQRMAYFVIDFLYHGQAPHRYVHVDQANAGLDLTEACLGADRAFLLQRTGGWPAQPWHELYADWKGLVAFLLNEHGEMLEASHFEGFDVLVYQLPDDVAFSLPPDFESVNLDVGQGLELVGAASGFSPGNDSTAWLALQWQARGVPDADYAVQVSMVEKNGQPAARADKLLLSTEFQPTSSWTPGQQEEEYYVLEGLPRPAGDEYSLEITVYPVEEGGGVPPYPAAGDWRTFVVGTISPSGELLVRDSITSPRGVQ